MNKILSIFFVLLLMGCASSESILKSNYYPTVEGQQLLQWQTLIGKWHGKQPTADGGMHEWLTDNKPDGTYEIHFRFHKADGSFENKIEVGQWGSSGNIYFSIYRADVLDGKIYPVSTSDPTNYDAYYILNLTKDEFEYRHARTGDHFKERKVTADYSL